MHVFCLDGRLDFNRSGASLATISLTRNAPMQRGARPARPFIHFSDSFCYFLLRLPHVSCAMTSIALVLQLLASQRHRLLACSSRASLASTPATSIAHVLLRCFTGYHFRDSDVSHAAWRLSSAPDYTFSQWIFTFFSLVVLVPTCALHTMQGSTVPQPGSSFFMHLPSLCALIYIVIRILGRSSLSSVLHLPL